MPSVASNLALVAALLGTSFLPKAYASACSGTLLTHEQDVQQSVPIQGCPRGGIIKDVKVNLDITHSWVGDMRIGIGSMDDEVHVMLMQNRGGYNDGFLGTFDDDATVPISDATGPVLTGDFTPEQPLSAFDGISIGSEENWTVDLNLVDTDSSDNGCLNAVSIDVICEHIDETTCPNKCPTGLSIADSNGQCATSNPTDSCSDHNECEILGVDCDVELAIPSCKLDPQTGDPIPAPDKTLHGTCVNTHAFNPSIEGVGVGTAYLCRYDSADVHVTACEIDAENAVEAGSRRLRVGADGETKEEEGKVVSSVPVMEAIEKYGKHSSTACAALGYSSVFDHATNAVHCVTDDHASRKAARKLDSYEDSATDSSGDGCIDTCPKGSFPMACVCPWQLSSIAPDDICKDRADQAMAAYQHAQNCPGGLDASSQYTTPDNSAALADETSVNCAVYGSANYCNEDPNYYATTCNWSCAAAPFETTCPPDHQDVNPLPEGDVVGPSGAPCELVHVTGLIGDVLDS